MIDHLCHLRASQLICFALNGQGLFDIQNIHLMCRAKCQPSGPCRPRGSWTGELGQSKAGSVEDTECPAHVGKNCGDCSAHRKTELRTSKAERTVMRSWSLNLGPCSETKNHQPWASRAYKKLGLLGPAHAKNQNLLGNLRLYIFSKDSRWFGCPWGFEMFWTKSILFPVLVSTT